MKLLLVDDSDNNRLSLSVLLEDEGYEVDTAASSAEARAGLGAATAPYDLVLLDLHLGDGLGTELIPVVRALGAATKIVMMSGSNLAGERFVDGADAAFEKGTPFPELCVLLRGLLGG